MPSYFDWFVEVLLPLSAGHGGTNILPKGHLNDYPFGFRCKEAIQSLLEYLDQSGLLTVIPFLACCLKGIRIPR